MKTQGNEQKRISQERIRELIAEFADGSQQEFCDACGISKSSVSQYVNGTNAPGNMTAAKIGNRYNINPLWIMGFNVNKEAKSDADELRAFAEKFNENRRRRIISLNLRDTELEMIEKYRYLDDYGKDIVDTVLEKEHARCVEEDENTTTLSIEEIRSLPLAERMRLGKYVDGDVELKIARKRGKK